MSDTTPYWYAISLIPLGIAALLQLARAEYHKHRADQLEWDVRSWEETSRSLMRQIERLAQETQRQAWLEVLAERVWIWRRAVIALDGVAAAEQGIVEVLEQEPEERMIEEAERDA